MWFQSYPLPVYQAFETTFQFRISSNDAVLNGGDGIAFVIQNSSSGPRALGGPGSDLGISRSTRFRSRAVHCESFKLLARFAGLHDTCAEEMRG
jgi:hypothetical protein